MSKRRVAFVINKLNEGGAQKNLVFVANACAENGFEVCIISMTNTKPTLEINKAIKLYFLDNQNRKNRKGFASKLLFDLHEAEMIQNILLDFSPSVLCVFLPYISLQCYIALKCIHKVKDVYKIVSERENPYGFSTLRKVVYTFIYSKYDQVVFQTEMARECYARTIRKKSTVIPNPCIPRKSEIVPYQGKRDCVILSAARLEKIKGHDIAIKAFKIFHDSHPDYIFRIYGEGRERPAIENLIQILGLEESVFLKGSSDDVFADEIKDKMLVLSSYGEGIPNVVIEAMAAGMPCVCSDCLPGGPRMLLNNGSRGLLFSPGDVKGLAESMAKMADDDDFYEKCVNESPRVRDEYNPTKIKDLWMKVIERSNE